MSRLMETFTIGGMPITALSDGAPERALGGFFNNVDPAAWTRALGISSPDDLVPFNFGVFLLRTEGHTVLIDSGFGPPAKAMGAPGGGELLDRLAEAGVRPDEVTDIIHTHLHGDHCGWNVVDGKLTFANATIRVAQKELDHWLDPAGTGERYDVARSQSVPVQAAGHLETFSGDGEILPGLTAIPTPGHTPGHTSIMVSAGNEHLLITGDAAHHPVHFEHHDWIPGVDIDPAESSRSRAKLSALAADRDAVVTGGHFPISRWATSAASRAATGGRASTDRNGSLPPLDSSPPPRRGSVGVGVAATPSEATSERGGRHDQAQRSDPCRPDHPRP